MNACATQALPSNSVDPAYRGVAGTRIIGWLLVSFVLLLVACSSAPPLPFPHAKTPIEFIDYAPMEPGVLQRISLYYGYEVEYPADAKPILVIYRLDLDTEQKQPLAAITVDGIVINEYSRKSMFAVSWDSKTLMYMHDQSAKGPQSLRSKPSGLYEYVIGRGERVIHEQARLISHSTFKLNRNAIEFAMGDPSDPNTQHYVRTTEGIESLQEEAFVMQYGGSALHRAAKKGALEQATRLIEEGFKLEEADNRGFTPLHVAIWNRQQEMAKLLIDSGSDVNKRMSGSLDWTPLEAAARFGLVDTAALLLDKGADINAKTRSGNTALHMAIDYKKLEVAELLINRGADVNAKANDGSTPLHIFAQGTRDERSGWNGSIEERVLKLMLAKGADVTIVNENLATPLHYAVLNNNIRTAQLLVENGANANMMELPNRHYYGRELHHEGSEMTLGQRMQETLSSDWWQQGE